MMWISFLINLFVVVKGRRFVLFSSIKGAQILAADFYLEKMSSFVPRRIETPVTKNEESEERRGNFEKKMEPKGVDLCLTKSAPFSKSSSRK
jgi:hypothetical protein